MHSVHTIVTGRKLFREELSEIYDILEIDSLYSMVIENRMSFNKTQQLLHANENIEAKKWAEIQIILGKLKSNEPIQYVINESEFYDLKFKLNNNVLIPRQETELLVDLLIKEHQGKAIKILDIGTGSGCIAIALKKNLPNAKVTALDISELALAVARQNADLNKVEIEFIQADILKDQAQLESFDIIVSNPPYVKDSEKELMKPNVLTFEPHLALFVPDNDALRFYEAISRFASTNLNSGGQVWLEINEALGAETAELFSEIPINQTLIIEDLNGKQRFVKVW